MKLSKILFGVAAAAMFAACSSDEIVQSEPQWGENGTGFMALNLSMPATMQTRANDNFDNGDADEYKVNKAVLVIFTSDTDESQAKFFEAYNLDLETFDTATNPGITVDKVIAAEISRVVPSKNLYAMVVLNDNGLLAVGSDHSLTVNGSALTKNTSTVADLMGNTVTGLDRYATKFTGASTDNFLMMNAPMVDVAGGINPSTSTAVLTLAPVHKENIKPTKAEAQAAPAASVYVERAVAKVTLKDGTGAHTISLDDLSTIAWQVDRWALSNTNTKSYFLRNFQASNLAAWKGLATKSTSVSKKYRFVGDQDMAIDHHAIVTPFEHLYRTYFAIDPNYSADASTDLHQNSALDFGVDKDFKAITTPLYCAENTFDVANQTFKNTTSAVVETTLKGGATFYTKEIGTNTIYAESDVLTQAKTWYLSLPAIATFRSTHLESSVDNATFEGLVTIALDTRAANGEATFKATWDLSSLAPADFKSGHDATESKTAGDAIDYETLVPAENKFYQYVGGKTYYDVRIQHFGKDLTPWNTEKGTANAEYKTGYEPTAGLVPVIYPDADDHRQTDNYLGRYGVLRNNWYELTVNSISKIGYPTYPDWSDKPNGGNTPDDELNPWIAVDVNILSWAKRTQDVDF